MVSYRSETQRRLDARRNMPTNGFAVPNVRYTPPVTAQTPIKQAEKPGFMSALGLLTSGEQAINFLSDEVLEKIPGWGKDRHSGTRIRETLEMIPFFGKPAAVGFDIVASPLTLATAGFGGPVAGALRGAGPAGRIAAGFVAPVARSGGFGQRVAAETGIGLAGRVGSEAAERGTGQITDDETVKAVASVLGGIAGGAYAARSLGKFQNYYAMTPAERSGLPVDDPRRKLLDAMTTARQQNIQHTRDIRKEMGQRAAEAFEHRQGIQDPVESMRVSREYLGGKYGDIEGIGKLELSEDDVAALWERIINYKPFQSYMHEYERNDAISAFNKLLTNQRVENNELKRLGKALGVQLSDGQITWRAKLDDVVNLPRAVMASIDFSAPFQQGVVAITRPEWWKAWGPALQAVFKDDTYARAAHEEIMGRPTALLRERAGVHISPLFESVSDNKLHEEAFRSSLAEHLPIIGGLIRRSNLGYTTFLNRLRADLFDSTIEKWTRNGGKYTGDELRGLGRWINTVTGRGNLSPDSLIGDLNWLFFSPRRLAAWGETVNPVAYAKASPRVRAEMLRDITGFLAMGMTALSMTAIAAKATGADIHFTLDPRSPDFGKVRVGQTRYNPWSGLQPLMRYGAQVLTGQRVTSTGKTQEVNRAVTAGRFIQSKMAPVPGFLLDWLRGETYTGEEFDVSSDAGLLRQVNERLLPLFIQDLSQAIQREGLRGALKQAPSITGFGVQTYGDYAQIRNDKAMQDFNLPWDRLTATQKAEIESRYAPELAAVNRDAKEGEFRFHQVKIDESTRAAERSVAEALAVGAIDARQFNASMQDIAAQRATSLKATREALGIKDDPNDLIGRYLALREQATVGGVTDYALLDQLQESFKANLTNPQDRAILEDFGTFDHDPSVSGYFEAKKRLRDAGYWTIEQQVFARHRAAVERVAPGIRTRDELERAIRMTTNRVQAVRMESLLSRIDSDTKIARERLRLQDPSVDRALVSVYGAVPIKERSSGRFQTRRSRRRERSSGRFQTRRSR